jgi:hypothetical protein
MPSFPVLIDTAMAFWNHLVLSARSSIGDQGVDLIR